MSESITKGLGRELLLASRACLLLTVIERAGLDPLSLPGLEERRVADIRLLAEEIAAASREQRPLGDGFPALVRAVAVDVEFPALPSMPGELDLAFAKAAAATQRAIDLLAEGRV